MTARVILEPRERRRDEYGFRPTISDDAAEPTGRRAVGPPAEHRPPVKVRASAPSADGSIRGSSPPGRSPAGVGEFAGFATMHNTRMSAAMDTQLAIIMLL
jgi:hypothetical protein